MRILQLRKSRCKTFFWGGHVPEKRFELILWSAYPVSNNLTFIEHLPCDGHCAKHSSHILLFNSYISLVLWVL